MTGQAKGQAKEIGSRALEGATLKDRNPKVTALIAVYNGETFLREAIGSILDQTFTDFELLVVDDGSTDGSAHLVEQVPDARVRLIKCQQNRGAPAALNVGIEAARGSYIARLDADDKCYPSRLQKQVDFLDRNPSVGMVGSWAHYIDAQGKVFASVEPLSDPERIATTLLEGNCFVNSSVMYRTALVRNAGGYDGRFKYVEDYDLWLRLQEVSMLANIPEHLVGYRIHAGQISTAKLKSQHETGLRCREAARCRRGLSSSPEDSGIEEERASLISNYLAWSIRYARMGERRQAFALLRDAWRESNDAAARWRIARMFAELAIDPRRAAVVRWYLSKLRTKFRSAAQVSD